jgi:hypothetical protein
VTVVQYTPGTIILGGSPYVIVRGLVANDSGVIAREVTVTLTLRRGPGGEVLSRPAVGLSWLSALSPGERGPFQVSVPFCCPEEVGHYEFAVSWRGASRPRYRELAASAAVTRTVQGRPVLFGDLTNVGDGYTDASTTRVFLAFWDEERFVDGRSAVLPLPFDDGPGGAGQGPGLAIPWSVGLPELAYDRFEIWPMAEAFPEGGYPLPLGMRAVTMAPQAAGVVLRGRLFSCATRPATAALVLAVARDGAGRPLAFDHAFLDIDPPLAPGLGGQVTLTWPEAPPEVAGAEVALLALGLDEQPERPEAALCADPRPRLWLPALEQP